MTRGPDPAPLPSALIGRPFLVGEGTLSGATPARLRAHDLDRRVWGVRHIGDAADVFLERCRMYAIRMPPDAYFSHLTAARLWEIPLPVAAERRPDLHIGTPIGQRAPHAAGIRGHQLTLDAVDLTSVTGLRVTSPGRTWCDLASLLSLYSLVAAGDYLIHWRSPLVGHEELLERTRRLGRRRGASRARAAVSLLNDRAESPPESELRVILQLGGLPVPDVNYEVGEGGEVRVDFAYPRLKLAFEYQGDYHRSRAQWRKDMSRRARLEAMGWQVVELNADDLKDPEALVALVRTIVARRSLALPR